MMPSTRFVPNTFSARAFAVLSLLTTSTFAHAVPAVNMMASQLEKRALTNVGCYSNATPLTEVNTYAYQSQGYCQTHCSGGVIGLTNGDTCYCGNELPANSAKVDNSKCSTQCTGWTSMCGGNGFWTVYLTGTEENVPTYESSGSSGSSSSSAGGSKSHPTTSSTAPPTVVTSQVSGGSTVVITVPGTVTATPTSLSTSNGGQGGGGSNTVGIAVGVVVGLVALAGIVAGVYFFLRHRQQKQAETDYMQRTQVADFMRSTNEHKRPGTTSSGMSDSRLDPEAGRRNSIGSLADNQDYSRRILRVANPDSS